MEENQPLSHFRRPSPGPEKQPVPLVDYVLNAMKFVDASSPTTPQTTTAGSSSHRKASCRSWEFSACPTCPSTSQLSQPAKLLELSASPFSTSHMSHKCSSRVSST